MKQEKITELKHQIKLLKAQNETLEEQILHLQSGGWLGHACQYCDYETKFLNVATNHVITLCGRRLCGDFQPKRVYTKVNTEKPNDAIESMIGMQVSKD